MNRWGKDGRIHRRMDAQLGKFDEKESGAVLKFRKRSCVSDADIEDILYFTLRALKWTYFKDLEIEIN